MNSSDRADFEQQMRVLCEGMGVPPTKEKVDAFWIGLQKMHIAAFKRVVEWCLGPDSTVDRKSLSTPKMWEINTKLRREALQAQQGSSAATPQQGSIAGVEKEKDRFDHRATRTFVSFGFALVRADKPQWSAASLASAQHLASAIVDECRRLDDEDALPEKLREMFVQEYRPMDAQERERTLRYKGGADAAPPATVGKHFSHIVGG